MPPEAHSDAARLRAAIDADDLPAVRSLLSAQPGLVRELVRQGDRNYQNQRPLTYASQRGNVDVVRLLLEAGADPCEDGNLPMARASLNDRNIPVMELLVAAGASVNAQAYNWGPILTHPCESLAPKSIRWLLDRGADPNLRFPGQRFEGSALDLLLDTYSRSHSLHECVNAMVEAGAKSRFPDGPAMDIHRGRIDLLTQRLDADPELVHRRFPDLAYGSTGARGLTLRGGTLLHVAAEFGEVEVARLLLARGADVNAPATIDATGVGGQTPIFHAVTQYFNWSLPVAELLIAHGADLAIRVKIPGQYADNGPSPIIESTPLGYAVQFPGGSYENKAIELLRRHGASE